MRHVVFKTPGLIDIRAFIVMGLSSKPGSDSPIGKFGTGLKMAIAVLVRNDIKVVLWIGRTKYTFKKYAIKFRGLETTQIKMEKEVHGIRKILSKSYELLPFTTELGKYWELWQAFRELESNTRDEQGQTFLYSDSDEGWETALKAGPEETKIIVSGEKFVQEYLDREKTFLPDGLTLKDESSGDLQIIDRPSKHIYWRGIRVYDLPKDKPSLLTYNVLSDIELTEDRTAKDTWNIDWTIKRHVVALEDKELVTKVVEAPKESYEGSFDYDYISKTPTPTFTHAASSQRASPAASRYAQSHLPKPPKEDLWKEFPRPWTAPEANSFIIYDANGKCVCEAKSAMIMAAILNKVNQGD